MKLFALADFKSIYGISGTSDDALLALLISQVSRRLESYCKRTFTKGASDATEYMTGGSKVLEPKQFPISGITSIIEDNDRLFTGDALDATSYYQDGRFIYRVDGERWSSEIGTIKLVYNGGYTDSGGTLQAVDDAIVEAAMIQTAFIYQRRLRLGTSSVAGGDGSVQTLTEVDLLPEVRKALMPFRRNPLNV